MHTNNIVQANALGKQVTNHDRVITILEDINLAIKQGESIAIIGVSGSGKSTLLGLLAGLDIPTTGSVLLNAHNLSDLDEDQRAQIRNQYIGFVFQSFQLLPNLTALENTTLPLEIAGNNQAKTLAKKLLEQVGLSDRLHHYPNQLSGGEQQRVAIARAFVSNPKILFADEPTGNLDQNTARQITDILFALNQENGTTLIIVTHDPEFANRCDRTVTIKDAHLHEN